MMGTERPQKQLFTGIPTKLKKKKKIGNSNFKTPRNELLSIRVKNAHLFHTNIASGHKIN